MLTESEERRKVKSLLTKGDNILFPRSKYMKVSRILIDLNRVARINREIDKDQVLFSVRKEGAPQGKFFVIRNY